MMKKVMWKCSSAGLYLGNSLLCYSLMLRDTAFLFSQLVMRASSSGVSYFGVSGAEYTENEEYGADEAEEGGSWDSSGEDIKVTRKKRHKRWHITLCITK